MTPHEYGLRLAAESPAITDTQALEIAQIMLLGEQVAA